MGSRMTGSSRRPAFGVPSAAGTAGPRHRPYRQLPSDHAPPLPPHIALQQLRRHTSKAKIGLACHPSTPGHIIRRLADDPVPGVRAAAAGHPLCPPAVLDRLARDPKPSVRAAVASSPVPASPATFERLAQDTAVAVRSAAAANLCCPSSQLSRLAQSVITIPDYGSLSTRPLRLTHWPSCCRGRCPMSGKPPGTIRRCPVIFRRCTN